MQILRTIKLLAASAAALLAVPAQAQSDQFVFTSLNPNAAANFMFTADSSPTPSYSDPSQFFLSPITTTANGLTYDQDCVAFQGPLYGGAILNSCGSDKFNLYGTTLFTGPTSDPTFRVGTFNLMLQNGAAAGTLVISETAVPEPSAWLMMLVGFGMIGLSLQASRSRRVSWL